MSPIKKEADPNLVAQFCFKLNNDLDGAQIAIDLITNKMHSNQEWEAWIALYVSVAFIPDHLTLALSHPKYENLLWNRDIKCDDFRRNVLIKSRLKYLLPT